MRWMGISAGITLAAYGAYTGFIWLRYGSARPSSRDEVDAILDQFMPSYDVAIRNDIQVDAPAAITQRAATGLDIQRLTVAGALFTARARLLGGTRDTQNQEEAETERLSALLPWMESLGWIVLATVPDREVIVGTITRPWEANPTPRVVPAAQFAAFHEPGYVKIATAWGTMPVRADACQFTVRTRVTATDAAARRRFRRYWALFSPGSLLIRVVASRLIKGKAERQTLSTYSEAGPLYHGPA